MSANLKCASLSVLASGVNARPSGHRRDWLLRTTCVVLMYKIQLHLFCQVTTREILIWYSSNLSTLIAAY